MDNATAQAREVSAGFSAVCAICGDVVYAEDFATHDGVLVKLVSGTSRVAVDDTGTPIGPVIPYCPKEH